MRRYDALIALVLWWLALLLVAFGIIETWRGNSVGEMQNFILGGIALRLVAKDLFE
jgi:hypothetical protein